MKTLEHKPSIICMGCGKRFASHNDSGIAGQLPEHTKNSVVCKNCAPLCVGCYKTEKNCECLSESDYEYGDWE